MISWMTMVILSAPRRSTSGRAPWFSAIIRFWIRVESLNRPPTLLTIISSFSSSSIGALTSGVVVLEDGDELRDAGVEVVVDEDLVVPVGLGQFLTGLAEPSDDRDVRLGPAATEAL